MTIVAMGREMGSQGLEVAEGVAAGLGAVVVHYEIIDHLGDRNRVRIENELRRIRPGGGTAIFPAMDAAAQDLALTRAVTKHVILLTDGQGQNDEPPRLRVLVDAMAADGRKSAVEARVAKTVKTLVEGVVGPGKARVNVTADLDLSQVTIQQETFDPDGQVVRSETTSEENANENQPSQSGAVTAAANIPGAPPNAEGNVNSASGRTGTTTNYDISKTVRTEVKEPGQVKRLSVAVAVDGLTAPAGKDGKPGAYTARSAAEMQRIEQLVRTAVGFDAQRGDQVTVINVQFPGADTGGGVVTANPLMGFDKNDIMQIVQWVILLIVALLTIFFVVQLNALLRHHAHKEIARVREFRTLVTNAGKIVN
jgi:flagellar biosynthesis/type III secretory pathway M-ring protein FliF/YscJ